MQQWICDAVVVPSKPLNVTLTDNVFATSSVVTIAKPIPGDAFGGDSAGPERLAVYVIVFAWLPEIGSMSAASKVINGNDELAFMVRLQSMFEALLPGQPQRSAPRASLRK